MTTTMKSPDDYDDVVRLRVWIIRLQKMGSMKQPSQLGR